MAVEGTGAVAARELGQGWKISPSHQYRSRHQVVTLADIDGPGAIQHIWMTVHPNDLARGWSCASTGMARRRPRSKCPLGDFFCNGWCERCNVNSLPVAVNPAGGFNCYWEMPFREQARITARKPLRRTRCAASIYQINYTLTDVPETRAYFHAQWRRSNPLPVQDRCTPCWTACGARAITWAPTWPGA